MAEVALFGKKAKKAKSSGSSVDASVAEEPRVVDQSVDDSRKAGRKKPSKRRRRRSVDDGDKANKARAKARAKKSSRAERKAMKEVRGALSTYPHLMAIKPRERYVFHSDYFQVDTYYCTIMTFFHNAGATDNFGPFWGINRIPSGLDDGVTTINFEQVARMGEGWIAAHQTQAENVAERNDTEQVRGGTQTTKTRSGRAKDDLEQIARELNDGASYLSVHNRLLIKAPSLEVLEDSVTKIERLYLDRFGTMWATPRIGEQRRELSNLFTKNRLKSGKPFYFTSMEYAGSYSLVTHGLEDSSGEYVGYMVGDVNNSAVLFDVNNYRHHVVIASEQMNEARGRIMAADMWGSKISQSCMIDNGRSVHIIMDGADLDKLGPKFEGLSSRVDMNVGDVNMFEMFGTVDEELAVFPQQMRKLILMAEQAYETTDSDRSIIRGSLEDVATKFYIDNRMWYEDAAANRERLRVVGIPHDEVPRLQMFVTYLDMEYNALVHSTARDDEKLHALSVLSTTFHNLLSSNGDLFDTTTNPVVDEAGKGRRVVYDFSQLMRRGKGVAMAQLVNVIGFAVGNLGRNDVVVIHGAEYIDPGIREYVTTQFEQLWAKGGRVAYCYNSVEKMLRDDSFNHFDKADYTILGNMSDNVVKQYQKQLGQKIPADLASLITDKSNALCYIRRGFDNVVFRQDLKLDPVVDAVRIRR